MPEFEVIGWISNLTPPAPPLSIAGITVQRPAQANTVDDTIVQRAAEAAGLSMVQTIELRQAVAIRRQMVIECEMRAHVDAKNEQAAAEALIDRLQNLIMAVQLLTMKAVILTGWAIGRPAGGVFFVVGEAKKYRGGPATITGAQVAVLGELVDVFSVAFPQRVQTAMLEFDTALKSEDVRRQFIHAVVALEALFGDQSTEALSYKAPLRAVQIIPSAVANKKTAYKKLRKAYELRSRFVHGTWDDKTLKDAEGQIDAVLSLTGEAVQQFLFKARDGNSVDFPELDDELFLGVSGEQTGAEK